MLIVLSNFAQYNEQNRYVCGHALAHRGEETHRENGERRLRAAREHEQEGEGDDEGHVACGEVLVDEPLGYERRRDGDGRVCDEP